jgi:DNA polymerase/3'-5' exonuclease PolX
MQSIQEKEEMKTLYPLEEATRIGERILSVIDPLVEKAVIAGSIRRRKSMVHDIDIVLIPSSSIVPGTPFKFDVDFFPNGVISAIEAEFDDVEAMKKGSALSQIKVKGIPVDLYASNEEEWGIHLLRWTGSQQHNIKLCMKAKELGYRLRVSRGLIKNSKVIASRNEEDIFDALDMDYIEPWERT